MNRDNLTNYRRTNLINNMQLYVSSERIKSIFDDLYDYLFFLWQALQLKILYTL